MGYKIGLDAALFRNTGTFATPTFEEIDDVQEATTTLGAAVATLKARALGWTQSKRGIKDPECSVTLLRDGADAGWLALRDAFLNGTLIELWFADGPSAASGTQGLRAEFEVTNMEDNQPLEEGLGTSFTVKPGISTNTPEWKEVP